MNTKCIFEEERKESEEIKIARVVKIIKSASQRYFYLLQKNKYLVLKFEFQIS